MPSTVIHQQEALDATPTEQTLVAHREFKIAEIQSELNAGRKIHAIKLFRDAFGADLSTAKQAVEMLETGQRLPREALSQVAPQAPVEQRVYSAVQDQEAEPAKRAVAILWLIVSIGIALLVVFLVGDS